MTFEIKTEDCCEKMTDNQGCKSLVEIRRRIEEVSLDPYPITAVLEISFAIQVANDCTKKQTLRNSVRVQLREDFVNALKAGVRVELGNRSRDVVIEFDETYPGSGYFTTKDASQDVVKAIVLTSITNHLNQAWATRIDARSLDEHITSATMNFLLSKPLEYIYQGKGTLGPKISQS